MSASFLHSSESLAGHIKLETLDAAVFAPDHVQPVAEAIAEAIPEEKKALERILGWPFDFRVEIWLISDRKQFEQITGSPFFSALADGSRRLIVMDVSKGLSQRNRTESTLRHELCHLLLHRHLADTHLPRWFNEGVAQWASDGFSELLAERKGDVLRTAAIADRLIPLKSLSHAFPRSQRPLLLAYEESRSIVEYITEMYGRASVIAVLDRMKGGAAVETAVREVLPISLDELEKQWRKELRGGRAWLVWVSIHLYEILFFAAALASMGGFFRYLIRKRRYAEMEEFEESGED